jgi:Ssp1 endopeptidase immunity protein Rap1a
MNIRTIAVAIAVAISASTAAAEDGNSWSSRCRITPEQRSTTTEGMWLMNCSGYARGVADTIQLWRGAEGDKAPACIPEKVTTQQLIDVGLRFMRENPAERHLPAGVLLTRAFSLAWPCKK